MSDLHDSVMTTFEATKAYLDMLGSRDHGKYLVGAAFDAMVFPDVPVDALPTQHLCDQCRAIELNVYDHEGHSRAVDRLTKERLEVSQYVLLRTVTTTTLPNALIEPITAKTVDTIGLIDQTPGFLQVPRRSNLLTLLRGVEDTYPDRIGRRAAIAREVVVAAPTIATLHNPAAHRSQSWLSRHLYGRR